MMRQPVEKFIDEFNRHYGFLEIEQKELLEQLANNLYNSAYMDGMASNQDAKEVTEPRQIIGGDKGYYNPLDDK